MNSGQRYPLLVQATGGVGLEDPADLIADAPKDGELLFLGADRVGRVLEAPMVAVDLARKKRTGLVGIPADRNHRFDGLVEELLEMLRAVRRKIDSDFPHSSDGERMDVTRGPGARAGDAEAPSQDGAQDAFGKMAAAGIAGAENEDERWFHHEAEGVGPSQHSGPRRRAQVGVASMAPSTGPAR